MKRILIFGKNGQVAWELQRTCALLGENKCFDSAQVNLQNTDQVVGAIREFKPTHVINAAAYTAVDKAESEESQAVQVNGHSVGAMADECKKIGASLIHYSTDYVFDGTKTSPYVETDKTSPVNAYGRSKLLGEKLIQEVDGSSVILRVSWVYGNTGANFYRTMLRLGAERTELKVVSDQFGVPTWSRQIAQATALITNDSKLKDKSGLYHLTPQGSTNWHEFAQTIFVMVREKTPKALAVQSVLAIKATEYPTPAKRPTNSLMNSDKMKETFSIVLPHWRESLTQVVEDMS